MTNRTCELHGIKTTDCAICHKLAHECDYGSCTRTATTKIANNYGEVRPACAKHAPYMVRVA